MGCTHGSGQALAVSAPTAVAVEGVEVTGAGTAAVNGPYLPAGSYDGVPQYVNKHGVTLLRYRFADSGRAFWLLSKRDLGGNDENDVDLYRTHASEAATPPFHGWHHAEAASQPMVHGDAPAPFIAMTHLEVDAAPFPPYWTSQGLEDFKALVPVAGSAHRAMHALLQRTFLGRRTRDRDGRVPQRLELVHCMRFEASGAWRRYAARRLHLLRGASAEWLADRGRAVLTASADSKWAAPGTLLESVNEFFLWHGTSPTAALSILDQGFRIDFAGDAHGAMFGAGAYFAESSSKADEYAKADGPGLVTYPGLCAMLLCRVCCGRILRVLTPDKAAIQAALKAGEAHSVLGDREAAVGTYREFVVYDAAQVYPEYVVLYARDYEEEELDRRPTWSTLS